MQKGQHHDLVGGQLRVLSLEFLGDLGLDQVDELAGHVGCQYFRMDVALPADRWRISKLLSDLLDGCDDVALRLSLAVVFFELRQRERREQVPAQVRKSLAVKSWPVMSRM